MCVCVCVSVCVTYIYIIIREFLKPDCHTPRVGLILKSFLSGQDDQRSCHLFAIKELMSGFKSV